MFDNSQSSKRTESAGWIGRVVAWVGALALITGAVLIGPRLLVNSAVPFSPAQATVPAPVAAAPAVADAAASPAAALPTPVPTATTPPTATAVPTATAIPTATPAPVLEAVYSSPAPTATPTLPPLPIPVSLTPAFGYPPTHISISSIGVDAQVVPIGWQVETIGDVEHPVWTVPEAHLAGWHQNTVSLGMPGNTVINGHNWPEDAVFRNLYQVQVGDTITLYSGDKPFFYQVTESLLLPEAGQPLEVRQANAQYIQPTPDERVTLVTCHPYGRTTFRLIVIARPASSLGGN